MTHGKIVVLITALTLVGVVGISSNASAEAQHKQRPASMLSEKQKETVQERKAILQEKLTAAKEARQNKLEGKRLDTCKKRSSKINRILSHGTDQSRKHLATFQAISERVQQFYVNKNLNSEGYDAAVAKVDEKEAEAVAAIEASTESTFDCASTDGAKPGEAIKELMTSRHQALKEYRTAIKDLILVVKKAHGQQQSSEPVAEEER